MRTIAALSTPAGKGGISVIRISGDAAFEAAAAMFRIKSGKKVADVEANRAYYGEIIKENKVIDDGIAVFYKAPHSYTGEDTVEISGHGGVLVTSLVLEAAFSAGAAPAGPGEFTRRAFINGKITLSQAEAVGGMIDAVTEKQLAVSLLQSRGSLSRVIGAQYERLLKLAASVYAYIDYPDEDMTDVSVDEMKLVIKDIRSELNKLISGYSYGRAISEGVKTAVVGRPNAGKSSLFNRMLGYDRSIVTDIPGTTRDVVSDRLKCGSVLLNISDTAGIRSGGEEIEKIGIELSVRAVEEAELVIAVFDGSRGMSEEDEKIIELCKGKNTVAVLNKADLGMNIKLPAGSFGRIFTASAKTGEGVDKLCAAIEELCRGECAVDDSIIITNARQYAAVRAAKTALDDALTSLDGFTQEVAGMDIEAAAAALAELDGREISEAVVDEIFKGFCVGK